MFRTLKIIFTRIKPHQITFKQKFSYFQKLLAANDDTHRSMTELGELLVSGKPFSKGNATKYYIELINTTEIIIKQLILLSNGKYRDLLLRFNEIKSLCSKIMSPKVYCPEGWECSDSDCDICDKLKYYPEDIPYYLHITDIDESKRLLVGRKMTNLGVISNKLHIPVPDGFALTVKIFEDIMQNQNIRNKKNEYFYDVDFQNISEVQNASYKAQELINSTHPPKHIEEKILEAFDKFFYDESKLAIRSSARGEDSRLHSFAGLHHTELNVSRQNLIDAVIEVLLSKYSPESVTYRFYSGLRDEDMPMAIACIEMIDADAGGVIFTKDPLKKREGIIIQAVFGLGITVVESRTYPQQFIVEHKTNPKIISFDSGNQKYVKVPKKTDGLSRIPLSDIDNTKPCLTKEQINKLVEYSLRIEKHFQSPQDIEWAIDKNGEIYILQARPLILQDLYHDNDNDIINLDSIRNKLIIDKGECASRGVGYGQICLVNNLRDLKNISPSSIIVTKKNFAELSSVLNKASALITEVGSTTGHLSIIARELDLPFITNISTPAANLKNGEYITVYADESKVYSGKVEKLVDSYQKRREELEPFRSTPLYRIIHRLSKYVFKLNLTKPNSQNFAPEFCETIHDIIRFAHETAMKEMFSVYDNAGTRHSDTVKLSFDVPLDIYIIDLGNGLKRKSDPVTPEDINSKPMCSLIKGMKTPGIRWGGPLSVDIKGFLNIMMTNAMDSTKTERVIGSKSYALISENYLNFFSRLGYHFSRLDALADEEKSLNYLNFHFRGGAADVTRRCRRAAAIKKILEHYDFNVVTIEDNVIAKVRKVEKDRIYFLIELIGRLMGAVRNTDVTLTDDKKVELFVKYFLDGDPSPASRFIK